ncbi:MAG TPA: DNA polymerase domain-containing protein [Bryobacteraceae bacterium]|nr:DNA polymerase domain-containing protein [Bryobacteraceae bacterium]
MDGLPAGGPVRYKELEGEGELRFLVWAETMRDLTATVLRGAEQRAAKRALVLPPEEQYLVSTGRNYFRDLPFDRLRRMQFDLETTGLHPERDRIFLIALRYPDGECELLDDADEATLIRQLAHRVRQADPDVIENHNLHGFDLPFLAKRASLLDTPLTLGRLAGTTLRQRPSRRKFRFVAPGRELIDTMDAVLRYDFAARDLPGHGLKAVARHFGLAKDDREYIPGERIFTVYQTDPERVRRYATADVEEVAGVSALLSGAAYALARMAPRRYERLADAGAATGVLDPLLVRAYLREGHALPAHRESDGTPHSGAALHLFASGVARRIVKADVASLYPSLMRSFQIGPKRDRLGVLLALVDRLVERRLAAKAAGKAAAEGSAERFAQEAMSAAMKLVVNTAYGYLAAGGTLTRFADVHAANEVTRRGRETLDLLCRGLAARGVTLLEADTDGVYFSVPEEWTERDERRVVAEVAALLPPLVQLEFDGRYAAMLSHEPKNYALLTYGGRLLLRGVAFRSSRAEPFGETFLRRSISLLLAGDVAGVRAVYVEMLEALRRRALPTYAVSSRVRLTKSPEQYAAVREERRELAYEAMLASGRKQWNVGDKVRVYRTPHGAGGVVEEPELTEGSAPDPRDYDGERYARLLRDTYAARMESAFTAEDFAIVFAEPGQLTLFGPRVDSIQTVLQRM